jgi:flagellar basal-body rod protein FlgB
MQWLQARQTLVSANVANANTVGFQPLDLEVFHFGPDKGGLALTDPGHQVSVSDPPGGTARSGAKFETKPSGNAVVLDDEMAKLADT